MRYKTRGRDVETISNFSRIKFELGVARAWESVARWSCTSRRSKRDLQRVRELGMYFEFDGLIRSESSVATGRDGREFSQN